MDCIEDREQNAPNSLVLIEPEVLYKHAQWNHMYEVQWSHIWYLIGSAVESHVVHGGLNIDNIMRHFT